MTVVLKAKSTCQSLMGRLYRKLEAKDQAACRKARISIWRARRNRKAVREVENNKIGMLHMNPEAISSI